MYLKQFIDFQLMNDYGKQRGKVRFLETILLLAYQCKQR